MREASGGIQRLSHGLFYLRDAHQITLPRVVILQRLVRREKRIGGRVPEIAKEK